MTVEVTNVDHSFATSDPAYRCLKEPRTPASRRSRPSTGSVWPRPAAIRTTRLTTCKTVVPQGTTVRLGGTEFDVVNGVAIDLFCACPVGKVGPFYLNPGNPGLTTSMLNFMLPAKGTPSSPPTRPGSFVVSNPGFSARRQIPYRRAALPAVILRRSSSEIPAKSFSTRLREPGKVPSVWG